MAASLVKRILEAIKLMCLLCIACGLGMEMRQLGRWTRMRTGLERYGLLGSEVHMQEDE